MARWDFTTPSWTGLAMSFMSWAYCLGIFLLLPNPQDPELHIRNSQGRVLVRVSGLYGLGPG